MLRPIAYRHRLRNDPYGIDRTETCAHQIRRFCDQLVEQKWIEAFGARPQLKCRFQAEDYAPIRTVKLPLVPAPHNMSAWPAGGKGIWRTTPGLPTFGDYQNSLFCIHSRTSASASSCDREHRSLTMVTS